MYHLQENLNGHGVLKTAYAFSMFILLIYIERFQVRLTPVQCHFFPSRANRNISMFHRVRCICIPATPSELNTKLICGMNKWCLQRSIGMVFSSRLGRSKCPEKCTGSNSISLSIVSQISRLIQ